VLSKAVRTLFRRGSTPAPAQVTPLSRPDRQVAGTSNRSMTGPDMTGSEIAPAPAEKALRAS